MNDTKDHKYEFRINKKKWKRFLKKIKNRFDNPSEAMRWLIDEYIKGRII